VLDINNEKILFILDGCVHDKRESVDLCSYDLSTITVGSGVSHDAE